MDLPLQFPAQQQSEEPHRDAVQGARKCAIRCPFVPPGNEIEGGECQRPADEPTIFQRVRKRRHHRQREQQHRRQQQQRRYPRDFESQALMQLARKQRGDRRETQLDVQQIRRGATVPKFDHPAQ